MHGRAGSVTWGVAARPAPGETESGDQYLVEAQDDGSTLVAVVDGLGHGPEACFAAKLAVEIIGNRSSESLVSLMKGCDRALKNSRGAAISLAHIDRDARVLGWVGTGNVVGVVFHRVGSQSLDQCWLPVTPGVVGFRLGTPKPYVEKLRNDVTLIVATDGVSKRFANDVDLAIEPGRSSASLLSAHASSDDALVLVARVGFHAGE